MAVLEKKRLGDMRGSDPEEALESSARFIWKEQNRSAVPTNIVTRRSGQTGNGDQHWVYLVMLIQVYGGSHLPLI